MKTDLPAIMGIVNVTPDSFSDGGKFFDDRAAIAQGKKLAADGADILDIGGESTRPGAAEVPEREELDRVLPVIRGLAEKTAATISIDTRKPLIAAAAVEAGALIWNDVSALTFDADSLAAAADLNCGIVLMHAQGDPKTMQDNPQYDDVVEDVYAFLARRIEACLAAGVREDRLIIDPGVGFGKLQAHNLALTASLERFRALGRPVLFGASRKSFIGALDDDAPVDARLGGSVAIAIEAWKRGADIVRVHDVFETRQALRVACAIEKAGAPSGRR